MNKVEFKNLLKRYLSDDCTEREQLLVEGWYDWLGTENELEIENMAALEDEIWNRVKTKTIQPLTEEKGVRDFQPLRKWHQRPMLRIAASILFLLVSGFYMLQYINSSNFNQPTTQLADNNILTNFSTTKKVYWLADSSKVTMFPNSQLEIPLAFAKHSKREVHLKGIAIFDVTKNPLKPFLVHTGEVVTRVLGTSFKIVHTKQKENIEVEVLSGKVSVYNKTILAKKDNGVVLKPNQKVTYYTDDKHFVKAVVDNPILLNHSTKKASPINFVYKDTPIELVLQELEKNYGIEIVVDNERFKDCPLTADLKDQPLFIKMEMICTSLNATFEVQGTIHSFMFLAP